MKSKHRNKFAYLVFIIIGLETLNLKADHLETLILKEKNEESTSSPSKVLRTDCELDLEECEISLIHYECHRPANIGTSI